MEGIDPALLSKAIGLASALHREADDPAEAFVLIGITLAIVAKQQRIPTDLVLRSIGDVLRAATADLERGMSCGSLR